MENFVLLEQAIRHRKEMREELRRRLLKKIFSVLDELSPKYGYKEAYIFGSITEEGKFNPESDIDIAVTGLKNEKYFAFMAELFNKLEYEVDVVQLENSRLREKIESRGIRWTKRR